ncbi:MAG: DUF6172 family protein [Kiritimatiellaceae bacterium]|nr:DUF6172 family protein [Kiritimatiellaceae bacterium]
MKKTFNLTHDKIKYPRLVEATKNEVRKYIKRERRKELPEGVDFWDFDCKFGDTEAEARVVHLAELDACINDAQRRELISFYIEILAKKGYRTQKQKPGKEPIKPDLPKLKGFGEN